MRKPSFLSETITNDDEETVLPLNTTIDQIEMTPHRRNSIEQVSIETPIRANNQTGQQQSNQRYQQSNVANLNKSVDFSSVTKNQESNVAAISVKKNKSQLGGRYGDAGTGGISPRSMGGASSQQALRILENQSISMNGAISDI